MTNPAGPGEGFNLGPIQQAASVFGAGGMGGSIADLGNWEQPATEDFLKAIAVQDNPKVNDPIASVYGVLRQGISLPLAIVEALVNQLTGGSGEFLNLEHALSLLEAIPVFGDIVKLVKQIIFGGVPVSAITDAEPDLTPDSVFSLGAIADSDDWDVDMSTTRTADGTGSAKVIADGRWHALRSGEHPTDAIPLIPGKTFKPKVWVKHQGYVGTGAPIQLHVVPLTGPTKGIPVLIATYAPAGANLDWPGHELTGEYPVPDEVVGGQLRLVLRPEATAGTIWWDDVPSTQTGLLPQNLVAGLPEMFTNIVNTFLEMFGLGGTGNLLEDLARALLNIPSDNVGGVAGPDNIGSSVLGVIDQLVSGFVGVISSGGGLADIFNVGQEVSSRATRGAMAFDTQGIRSNKNLRSGFLPSSQSNLDLMVVAGGGSMTSVPITQSTALTGYERVEEAIDIGVLAFQQVGAVVGTVTHLFLTLYKMDTTTGVNTKVHESANLVGLLGLSDEQIVYEIPSTTFHYDPTEMLGMEIAIRGSGTLNVGGEVSGLADQKVYPRRWSSVRNSGTSAAPPTFTPTYGNNVPFIEFAVSAGEVDLPHSPQTVQKNAPGTTGVTTPTWANYIEVIELPGGGGGWVGSGPPTNGEGGKAGAWAKTTWERGVHFAADSSPVLSVTVGDGGVARGPGDPSDAGQASSVTLPATTGFGPQSLSTPGGAGGDEWVTGSASDGQSPGDTDYNGQPYAGGQRQANDGAAGNSPGGGGAGGGSQWVGAQSGGKGAPGSVWLRFRQT